MKKLISIWIMFVVILPASAFALTAEQEAIAWCVAKGATEPMSFAYCVGGKLTSAEIQKCLTGGDCFGKNNELRKIIDNGEVLGVHFGDIQKYGICGGPNSEFRKIFGSACSRACGQGSKGWIRLYNPTSSQIHFAIESDCGERTSFTLAPNSWEEFGGIAGDKWYNISFSSDGGGRDYGLDIGHWYTFEWQGKLLDLKQSTPRY